MQLRKVKQFGKHERDRLLRKDDLMLLRREITSNVVWKPKDSVLHIDNEVIECGTPQRAELIALLHNAMLAVLNDNTLLRDMVKQLQMDRKRMSVNFKDLWERCNSDKR